MCSQKLCNIRDRLIIGKTDPSSGCTYFHSGHVECDHPPGPPEDPDSQHPHVDHYAVDAGSAVPVPTVVGSEPESLFKKFTLKKQIGTHSSSCWIVLVCGTIIKTKFDSQFPKKTQKTQISMQMIWKNSEIFSNMELTTLTFIWYLLNLII